MEDRQVIDDTLPKEWTYTEKLDELCSYYMMVGVGFYEFWNGDPARLKYYRRAYEIETERKNQTLWAQGLYNFEAFASVLDGAFSKKGQSHLKYPSEPHRVTPLTENEQKEEQQNTLEKFRQQLNAMNKSLKQKHGW